MTQLRMITGPHKKTLLSCRIKMEDLICKTKFIDLEILLILARFLKRAPVRSCETCEDI